MHSTWRMRGIPWFKDLITAPHCLKHFPYTCVVYKKDGHEGPVFGGRGIAHVRKCLVSQTKTSARQLVYGKLPVFFVGCLESERQLAIQAYVGQHRQSDSQAIENSRADIFDGKLAWHNAGAIVHNFLLAVTLQPWTDDGDHVVL